MRFVYYNMKSGSQRSQLRSTLTSGCTIVDFGGRSRGFTRRSSPPTMNFAPYHNSYAKPLPSSNPIPFFNPTNEHNAYKEHTRYTHPYMHHSYARVPLLPFPGIYATPPHVLPHAHMRHTYSRIPLLPFPCIHATPPHVLPHAHICYTYSRIPLLTLPSNFVPPPSLRALPSHRVGQVNSLVRPWRTPAQRVCWISFRSRAQTLYDSRRSTRPRPLRRLWRIANRIRNARTRAGISQVDLMRGRDALSRTGVIYAIAFLNDPRVYVGQTINNVLKRFQAHYQQSQANSTCRVHKLIRQKGLDNVLLFPLEVINPVYEGKRGKARTIAFRNLAYPRETYWIRLLNTGTTTGLNSQFGAKRKRRHPKNNPMLWRRARRPRKFHGRQKGKRSGVPNSKSTSSRRFAYRDWKRRCDFLCGLIRSKGTCADRLKLFKKKNAFSLMNWLKRQMSSLKDFPEPIYKQLLQALRAHLLNRPILKKRVRIKPTIIKVRWESRLLNKVPFRSILDLPKIKSFLPVDFADCTDGIVICKKLRRPISDIVFNYKQLSRQLPGLPLPSSTCPCRKWSSSFRPDDGCVWTGDLTCINHSDLRKLLSFGPKFRDGDCSDPMTLLEEALDQFISRLCRGQVSPAQFQAWKIEFLNEVKERLPRDDNVKRPSLLKHSLPYLRNLQKMFVLCPADKASNNIVVICCSLYVHILRSELTSAGSAYTEEKRTQKSILTDHKNFLSRWHLPFEEGLPFLYWLPKLHKNPFGSRFIAACGRCSTKVVSQLVSKVLT